MFRFSFHAKDGKKNSYLTAGTVITILVLALILLGIVHAPYDTEAMNTSEKFAGFSLLHILGTDNFGRDVFSRVIVGAFTTLKIAAGTVAIGLLGGLVIGAAAGYFGGAADAVLMRINDTLFAFPSVLLALVIVSLFGSGTYNVIWALGIAFIPSFARMVRSEFLRYRESDFIAGARLQGAGSMRIMAVHIFPNTLPVLLSSVLIGFNNAVLAEAGLSYLGIGVQPPEPSLGRMLSEAQSYLMTAPLYAFGPGVMIILMVLGFSLLGEGVSKRVNG
ncbi:MAG: ABC transporter permease [Lachnospiraceae bacterium]|jgi:peptide/nickel transport system permease protein|nr:ABC transporter permease [Lachnospiraceae bacterium]